MKYHLISDVHLEFQDMELPGGDVLIVAGDLMEARSFGRNDNGKSRQIAKALKRFVNDEFKKYGEVLYVLGNHEYYGRSLTETEKLLKLNIPGNNWYLMNSKSHTIDDIAIFGTTLWTDINQDSPETHNVLSRNMSDFSVIEEFSTHRSYVIHQQQKQDILDFLNTVGDVPCVIITHHAPSIKSVNEKYEKDIYMNGGYFSHMDDIMKKYPNILKWFHGHMHDPVSYKVHQTDVICHPRGYAGYEATAIGYKPLEIDL